MKRSQSSYDKLSDEDKLSLLKDLYTKQKLSFHDIAAKYDTYPNKIRRDAKKLNISIRDKSQAQKNALKTGKHAHPTKGTKRPDHTKQKIGKSVMQSWDSLSDSELEKRRDQARLNWEQLDEDTKANMQQLANSAVRQSSKTGSKLEKFLHKALLNLGYQVQFHKEQSLLNTKLQIDLFLPTINTAVEVDGPSHFSPVWGEDALNRNITYDQKKEGLITGKGWHLVRIKQFKDFSPTRGQLILDKLVAVLQKCSNNKTSQKFVIED
jgi:very-short-patch-repair endonuclease